MAGEEQNNDKKMTAGMSVAKMGRRYLKWTAYGILILAVCVLQSLPRGIPPILGVRPTLIVPVVICIAMFEGPVGGAAAGVAGGFLWDLFSSRLVGFHSLILLVLCCAAGLLSQLLIRNNLPSCMLMTAAALALQSFLTWFFYGVLAFKKDLIDLLARLGLIALYSLALAPLLYLIVAGVARLLHRRE